MIGFDMMGLFLRSNTTSSINLFGVSVPLLEMISACPTGDIILYIDGPRPHDN
jgi:hypothetical protein